MNRSNTPEARIAAIRERSARCVGRALSRGGRKRGLDRAYLLERLDAVTARADAYEKRLSDLRKWAEEEATRFAHLADIDAPCGSTSPAGPLINAQRAGRSMALWDVVTRLEEEGEA